MYFLYFNVNNVYNNRENIGKKKKKLLAWDYSVYCTQP